jgi:hypothetical protein
MIGRVGKILKKTLSGGGKKSEVVRMMKVFPDYYEINYLMKIYSKKVLYTCSSSLTY